MFSRRDLLRATALGLASAACSSSSSSSTATKPTGPAAAAPKKAKRILILGGTGFLGPKTVEVAVSRGHSVTIFNRGKREKIQSLDQQVAPDIAAKVEHLYGNRDPDKPADEEKGPDGALLHPDSPKGLEQLVGKSFDAVIDNSGYFPRHVAASAQLLAKSAKQYIFISSISCYDEASIPATGGDETVKLATLADPKTEEMGAQFQNYGGLKALCEKATHEAFRTGATIVRPGYIVGPGDPTDRFTYWPMRIKKGGDVVAPGAPDDPLQWIDVRDLAEWLVTLVENETLGDFNAIGPSGKPARWGDVLETCVDAAQSGAKLEWIPQTFLEANELGEDGAFPIWTAPVGKYAGFHRWSTKRPEGAGLKYRSIKDTVSALLDWYPKEIERRVRVAKELEAAGKKGPKVADQLEMRAGLKEKQEQELLAKWRASKKG